MIHIDGGVFHCSCVHYIHVISLSLSLLPLTLPLSHTSIKLADGVDVYNILIHNGPDSIPTSSSSLEWSGRGLTHLERVLGRLHTESLASLMNGPIKKQLGIPEKVTWGGKQIHIVM